MLLTHCWHFIQHEMHWSRSTGQSFTTSLKIPEKSDNSHNFDYPLFLNTEISDFWTGKPGPESLKFWIPVVFHDLHLILHFSHTHKSAKFWCNFAFFFSFLKNKTNKQTNYLSQNKCLKTIFFKSKFLTWVSSWGQQHNIFFSWTYAEIVLLEEFFHFYI